jgi:hypothetical protein
MKAGVIWQHRRRQAMQKKGGSDDTSASFEPVLLLQRKGRKHLHQSHEGPAWATAGI